MIYYNTTAIEAVNAGRDTPDAFYHKSTLIATSKWHNTDGWRGHNVLTPEPGFKLIDNDFATDDWNDAIAAEHGISAQERKYAELEKQYGDIWIIYTPTSNVFATGQDILARDPDAKPLRGKTIGHKTKRFELEDGSWYVQYHATKVVQYNAATDRYTLDTGGWNTMTTNKRMTDALPAGWYTYRRNWVMYLHRPGLSDVEIVDGTEYAAADYMSEEA